MSLLIKYRIHISLSHYLVSLGVVIFILKTYRVASLRVEAGWGVSDTPFRVKIRGLVQLRVFE